MKLWHKVLIGLVLGIVTGFLLREGGTSTAWVVDMLNVIGQIFVRLIKMLVVPLIFTTIIAGLISMGDPRKLGSIGLKAVILFFVTTAFAVTIGLVIGTVIDVSAGVDLSGANPQTLGEAQGIRDTILNLVPTNPVEAMANGNVLPLIVFSVLFGVGILAAGDKGKPVGDVIRSAADVVLKIAMMVMSLAPYGVFALIAWVVADKGVQTLTSLFMLSVAVYLGCLIHIFFVHGSMVTFLAGLNPVKFFRAIIDPQLVAYSTSSSAATLPVSMSAARNNLGIQPPVASSVLPLGATVNMDGTALYVGIVTLFAAKIFGVELTMGDYFNIALMTTLVSIGTAAVPSASLFLIAGVLGVIGVGPEQTALLVGFILPFDRLLDMMRTATNVTGDLAVSTTVAKWEGEFDQSVFDAKNVQ